MNIYVLLSALGVLTLAVVEYQFLEDRLPWLQDLIDKHKLWVVPTGLVLSAVPTIISTLLDKLRTRRELAEAMVEETRRFTKFQTDYVQKRVKYMIPKAREVARGYVSDEYSKNVLTDCESYFKARKEGITVRAYYYSVAGGGRVGSRRMEYKLGDRDSPAAGRPKFSESDKDSAEARYTVTAIHDKKVIYCGDTKDEAFIRDLKLDPKRVRVYRSFITVPIFKDSGHDVIGMFSVNCDEVDILRLVDQHAVRTFAWFLSAALAMDATRETRAIAQMGNPSKLGKKEE